MYRKVIIYLWISVMSAAFSKDVRIIGGQDGERTEFPYLVSFRLTHRNLHFCAGAIITTQHILTAAHCFYQRHEFYYRATVHIGTADTTRIGSIHTIKEFFVHPDFIGVSTGPNGLVNDIAVVTVNGMIQMNELQKPINLPTRRITVGENVTLCGWGLISYPEERYPDKIQHAQVKIIDRYDCSALYGIYIVADQVCTHRENVGACIGDSGGPVIRNNEIVGIISFSKPCATHVPDLHADVFIHKEFILSIINSN